MLALSMVSRTAFVLIIFFLMLTLSCKNDACEDVICYNGVCVGGKCDCFPGYEGEDCSIETVSKFVGSWFATDDCDVSTPSYYATIAASSSATNVLIITNLGGLGSASVVYATVDSSNIFIDEQQMDNGVFVSGAGSINISGNQITMSYSAMFSPDSTIICSGLWSLQ